MDEVGGLPKGDELVSKLESMKSPAGLDQLCWTARTQVCHDQVLIRGPRLIFGVAVSS
jgi:hypothetical protein